MGAVSLTTENILLLWVFGKAIQNNMFQISSLLVPFPAIYPKTNTRFYLF